MAILTVKIVDGEKFTVLFEVVQGFNRENSFFFETPEAKFKNFLKQQLPGIDTKSIVVKASSENFYSQQTEESRETYQSATILSVTLPKNPEDLVTFISIIDDYFKREYFSSIRLGNNLITEELVAPARKNDADPYKKNPMLFITKRLLHIGNEKSNRELELENGNRFLLGYAPLPETASHLTSPLAHYENEVTSTTAPKFFIRAFMIEAIISTHPYLDIIQTACLNGDQISPFDKAMALHTADAYMKSPQRLIDHLIQLRMQLLINSCLGKRAHDKGKYKEGYTELLLLRSLKFSINDKGLLSTELTDNPEFKKFYALDKRNYGLLKPELEFLGRKLGWEFDETCDFETAIVFSRAFTMKLMPELSETTVESILESLESGLSVREDSSSQVAVSSNQASFFIAHELIAQANDDADKNQVGLGN